MKQKEIDQMKTDFISLASHQLRTSLTAMRWLFELLLGDKNLTDHQRELSTRIADSNIRMISFVNTLLNISRIQSGRIMIVLEDTDIPALFHEIMDDVLPKYGKGHTIDLRIDDSATHLSVDRGLFRHIMMNLLTNALKYSPEGRGVEVLAKRDHGKVIFSVVDHGYGIPQAQQSKVFERFFRGDNITGIVTDGTGLGLYLARLIVQSSGGEISFTSEEGKGTTFSVVYPEIGMVEKSGSVTIQS